MKTIEMEFEQLIKNDKVLAQVVKQVQLRMLKPKRNHFQSLVSSIISQQLSVKAADTIERRFCDLFGGVFPEPGVILKKSDVQLRKCGLSFSKISYIKNIAQAAEVGELDFKKLKKMSDEDVIQELVKIKGIGRWTAEMFLLFSLARPDVFSHGDLGLKNAIKKLYNLDPKVHKKKYAKLVESWSPHRSLISRYLWKSLDNTNLKV